MYKNNTFLAIIPARGGSKGLPRKNILPLVGKPLIHWTIEAAQQSQYLDRVILSSEDDEIISIAKQAQCDVPFIRPQTLAEDETAGIAPILHAIETLEQKYDFIVVLQPTSPLRMAEDIDAAIRLCIDNNSPFCVSVTEPDKHPYWSYTLSDKKQLQALFPNPPLRRQELPDVFVLNGAVYVAKVDDLLQQQNFLNNETLAFAKLECSQII